MIGLNYLAIIVATIVLFLLGWLWYGVLFQKPWMKAMGLAPGELPKSAFTPAGAIAANILATLVLCFVLAIFVTALAVTTFLHAIILAFWIWFGFVATIELNVVLFGGKSWTFYFINAGYQLLGLVVAAVILALW